MESLIQGIKLFGRFVSTVIARFIDHRGLENAAALTYTTLFAVVPMMTVTYSMLSAIPSLSGVSDTVQNFIFANFVPATGEVVQSYLSDFSQQARKLTVFGIGFLLVTSFLMLKTIDKALNQIWQVDQVRRGVSGFLLYWAILSLGPLLLGAGFLLTSYLASLKFISDTTALFGGEKWLLRLMPVMLSTLVFTLLYCAVPNRKVPVYHALAGAVFVALMIELSKAGFALFITLSPSYELIYGAFAAVPLFLLWIYLSWLLVLLGAVVVRSMAFFGSLYSGNTWPPLISMLIIVEALRSQFEKGQGLDFRFFNHQTLNVTLGDWEIHTLQLSEMGLIVKNDTGDWMLSKDLRQMTLFGFCASLPWPLPSDEQLMALPESDCWLGDLKKKLMLVNDAKMSAFNGSLDALYSRRV